MKDDFLKKLKEILSGSNNLSTKIETYQKTPMPAEKPTEDLVNNFMDQILDSAWIEEELVRSAGPSYHLSKEKKSYWLLNTSLKTLDNIKSGIEVIPIEAGGKVSTLCMIGQTVYSIPNDLLMFSGWN